MSIEQYKFRFIIAGGREFNDYALALKTMQAHFTLLGVAPSELLIISGMAKGADLLGRQIALEHNIPVLEMPAEWDRYGKSAGYRRNEDMQNKATHCIAFWDGSSKGTKHMIDIMHKHNKGNQTYIQMY